MKKILIIAFILVLTNSAYGFELEGVNPVNPLEKINTPPISPAYELKRATLTKNTVKNQYAIAMNKFMQSNVRSAYMDFRLIIDSITPNDYAYVKLTQEMASIGFFNLSELAMSKIQDSEISSFAQDDIKSFYFPASNLTQKDQIYLSEMYSNIMYNDQSREATDELLKQTALLNDSDYANYLVAFGSLKCGDNKKAKEYINKAISKNPQNINYKRLKAEIIAQNGNAKDALSEIKANFGKSVIFDKELHSSQEYVLYKTSKNEYLKKYHLAHYYYDKGELNKALGVLQTSISAKKNINKDVYSLSARVYFDLKEFEKAQDYAQKTLGIDKTDLNALLVLGDVAMRNQDYEAAQKYYKKTIGKDNTYHAEIALANAYRLSNNIEKAKNLYSKVLKISSKAYEAYYQMALLEPDRLQAYLKKSVAINPDFTEGWIDLANLEINKENYDKALSFLNISKYIDDNNFRYYYYLGLILKNKGLTAEANKNFERSLNINPSYTLAKKELSI